MTALAAWSVRLCALCAAAAIVRLVFPDAARRGVFVLLRAILLLSALSALLPAARDALDELPQTTAFTEEAAPAFTQDALWEESIRASLTESIRETLAADGIIPQEIRIDCTVGEEGVAIDGVTLVLSAPEDGLDERLTAAWGIPVSVEG